MSKKSKLLERFSYHFNRIGNDILANWSGYLFIVWLIFCFSGIFWGRDREIPPDFTPPAYYLP